jgi:hypothetical protein
MMGNALGSKPSGRLTRQEVCGVEREKNFSKDGFDAGLSRFPRDDTCDVVASRINRVAEAEQRRAAMS